MCWPSDGVGVERCGRRGDGDVEEGIESGEDEWRDVEYEGPVKRELEHLCRSGSAQQATKSPVFRAQSGLKPWATKNVTYRWAG